MHAFVAAEVNLLLVQEHAMVNEKLMWSIP